MRADIRWWAATALIGDLRLRSHSRLDYSGTSQSLSRMLRLKGVSRLPVAIRHADHEKLRAALSTTYAVQERAAGCHAGKRCGRTNDDWGSTNFGETEVGMRREAGGSRLNKA